MKHDLEEPAKQKAEEAQIEPERQLQEVAEAKHKIKAMRSKYKSTRNASAEQTDGDGAAGSTAGGT